MYSSIKTKIYVYTLAIGTLFSCSSTLKNKQEIKITKINGYNYQIQKIQISPGRVTLVSISHPKKRKNPILNCDKKQIPFYRMDNSIKAYIREPYFSKRKNYSCFFEFHVDDVKIDKKILEIEVIPAKFKEEKLRVDKRKIDLSKHDFERYLEEKKALESMYGKSMKNKIFFNKKFRLPLKSKITSPYGTKRIFNNKKKTHHFGVDFRARRKISVPTSNSGKVVFTGDLFFSGKTVIIDHGMDIFSMYCHLSKINAVVGEFVPQGTIIGKTGRTGRISGPHLHWGIKIQGEWIDGISLVKSGI